jgi:hypothetical protein
MTKSVAEQWSDADPTVLNYVTTISKMVKNRRDMLRLMRDHGEDGGDVLCATKEKPTKNKAPDAAKAWTNESTKTSEDVLQPPTLTQFEFGHRDTSIPNLQEVANVNNADAVHAELNRISAAVASNMDSFNDFVFSQPTLNNESAIPWQSSPQRRCSLPNLSYHMNSSFNWHRNLSDPDISSPLERNFGHSFQFPQGPAATHVNTGYVAANNISANVDMEPISYHGMDDAVVHHLFNVREVSNTQEDNPSPFGPPLHQKLNTHHQETSMIDLMRKISGMREWAVQFLEDSQQKGTKCDADDERSLHSAIGSGMQDNSTVSLPPLPQPNLKQFDSSLSNYSSASSCLKRMPNNQAWDQLFGESQGQLQDKHNISVVNESILPQPNLSQFDSSLSKLSCA